MTTPTHIDVISDWSDCPCDKCEALRESHREQAVKAIKGWTMNTPAKGILEAIKALNRADRRDVIATLADLETLGEFGKAEPDVSNRIPDDPKNAFSRTPSRREVNAGPGQSASGGGAERMIREYSDLAEQHGVVAAVSRLAGHVADIGGRINDIEKGQVNNLKLLSRVAAAAGAHDLAKGLADLVKTADGKEGEEAEPEEETEDEKRRKAEAKALAGERVLDGGLQNIWDALAGRGGPVVLKAEAIAAALDDDSLSLNDRLRLGSLAMRHGQA